MNAYDKIAHANEILAWLINEDANLVEKANSASQFYMEWRVIDHDAYKRITNRIDQERETISEMHDAVKKYHNILKVETTSNPLIARIKPAALTETEKAIVRKADELYREVCSI